MTLIQTPRLLLRSFMPSDLDHLKFLAPTDAVPITQTGLDRAAIANWLSALKTVDPSEGGAWAVTDLASSNVLGLVLYGDFQPHRRRVVISYGIEPESRGKGCAREALTGVIPKIFEIPSIYEIAADIEITNLGSLKLAAGLGFALHSDEIATRYSDIPTNIFILSRQAFMEKQLISMRHRKK